MPPVTFFYRRRNKTTEQRSCPTDPFTILELQNPSIGELYEVGNRWSTDFKALELWKGRSGEAATFFYIPAYISVETWWWQKDLRGGMDIEQDTKQVAPPWILRGLINAASRLDFWDDILTEHFTISELGNDDRHILCSSLETTIGRFLRL